MITSIEIITAIKLALKEFGEYTYYDKGAAEVMDIPAIVERLKLMTNAEIVAVLGELDKVESEVVDTGPCLSDICYAFDDWTETERCDCLFKSEIFHKWY